MLKKIFLFCVVYHLALVSQVHATKNPPKITPPIETRIVVDGKTGKVLEAHNANIKVYPASLTKIMTLYIVFDQIKAGKLSMNTKIPVSKKAASMPPSKLGMNAGECISIKDAIPALIVKSANDVAVAVAERISGSEKAFAHAMNVKAKKLGMRDTYFKNASGWHDPLQKTTARDMAKLAMSIKRDHADFYHVFSKTQFTFRGNVIRGHDKILQNYPGVNGLKTGYHIPAGFNIATTVSQNNKQLIAIVTGGRSAALRNDTMTKLLDRHLDMPVKFANKSKNKQPVNAKKISKNKIG